MSSLQEQLLKAGLVDEKKLARAEQEKSKRAKNTRKQRGKKAAPPKAARSQAQSQKLQRDRELNQKRHQEAGRKARAAEAKQLIDKNRLDRSKGEHPYSFVYRKKIKKIYVTEAQRDQLVAGQLAVATWVTPNAGRRFELVPPEVAEKIAARDEDFVVPAQDLSTAQPSDDDPYADYQVPDDLVW
jgi:uncharacterized protein YaiL (DUF2058 family)